MEIDFHLMGTYTFARCAGLAHRQALVVGSAAQYVDDALQAGLVEFTDGSSYRRESSAHKALDYSNFSHLAQSRVWVPFHFLPGNCGRPAGEGGAADLLKRLVVVPDSPVARTMLRLTIDARSRPYGLHRLGIAMHVYADTWSHQGFCGVRAKVNEATDLRWGDGKPASSFTDRIKTFFVSTALPLGHGAVLSLPDRPYARWSYLNGLGERVQRDNPRDFLASGHEQARWMRRWLLGDADAQVEGLSDADAAVVRELIAVVGNSDERSERWKQALAEGAFSFGRAEVVYEGRGPGSWKRQALGVDEVDGPIELQRGFKFSDWKRFHDALMEHRFEVLNRVLPEYDLLVG